MLPSILAPVTLQDVSLFPDSAGWVPKARTVPSPWLCALSFFPKHKPLTLQLHDAMSFQVTSAVLMCTGSVGLGERGKMGHSQPLAGHWALPQFFTNLLFALGICL